jgi:hypothetical protein
MYTCEMRIYHFKAKLILCFVRSTQSVECLTIHAVYAYKFYVPLRPAHLVRALCN